MTSLDAAWQTLIPALHASGCKAALAITGGGSGAIGDLLRVPGGSRLLVEAQVPYDEQALAAYIGFAPAQSCSAETAIAMARSALLRSDVKGAGPGARAVGLGATAALVSDRPRRGEHRFHIATVSGRGVAHCTGVMAKGRRDRGGEEDLVQRAIVLWLARACGVAAPSPRSLLDADELYSETIETARDPVEQLIEGDVHRLTALPDGQLTHQGPAPRVVLPGSFNPLHEGHVSLARVAEEIAQETLAYEISVTNVDKPPLAGSAIKSRLAQFAWKAPVELTRAPTFLEKSRLFPGVTFVIGADTAERLVARKYYGGDEDRMHAAMDEIGTSRARFLVAVRVNGEGRLCRLTDVAVPQRFTDLFTEIPEHRFRLDTSSSEIRARW